MNQHILDLYNIYFYKNMTTGSLEIRNIAWWMPINVPLERPYGLDKSRPPVSTSDKKVSIVDVLCWVKYNKI